MATHSPWRNRIVGHDNIAPSDLIANPANWRTHPRHQTEALRGVLNEVGWVQDVIVNRNTGHLIDGHLRVALAIERKEPTIPVIYVDLNEHEEALILATLDPLSAMAEADATKLRDLLDEVTTGEQSVQEMLGKLAADEGLTKFDPQDEWQGMPEFVQEDKRGIQQIVVHFATREDVAAFAVLVNQPITDKTRYIWYPEVPKEEGVRYRARES